VLGVDIETDVKPKAPLEVGERDNHHSWFHVIRSIKASFIVSRRRRVLAQEESTWWTDVVRTCATAMATE
jgi:hypothetical protein